MKKKILIIEDDVQLSDVLRENLVRLLFDVKVVDSVSAARFMIMNEKFDLLLMDYRLKHGLTSDKLLGDLSGKSMSKCPNEKTPIVVCSGTLDLEAVKAFQTRTADFLVKPFNFSDIEIKLNKYKLL